MIEPFDIMKYTGGRIPIMIFQSGICNYLPYSWPTHDRLVVFTQPSDEDLITDNMFNTKSNTRTNVKIEAYDIRMLPELLYNSSIDFIEILYHPKLSINKSSFYSISKLVEIRDQIACMNLPVLYSSCIQSYTELMDTINRVGYGGICCMHAYRYVDFIIRFERCAFDFNSALRYNMDDSKVLRDILTSVYPTEDAKSLIRNRYDVADTIYKNKYTAVSDAQRDSSLKLKEQIVDIVKDIVNVNMNNRRL